MKRKKLNSKTKFFLVIGFYILILIIWYLGAYNYFNTKVYEINQKRSELKSDMARLPILIKRTEQMNSLSDSLQSEINKLQSKAFVINDINKVKSKFYSFCRKYNIKVEEFSTISQIYYSRLEKNPDQDYLLLPANIVLSGNFINYINLIKNLEQFPYVLHFNYLKIVPAYNRANSIKVISVGDFLVRKK